MSAYASAGVDIEAGELAVQLMKASVAKATRPEVIGGIGGFAGLFDVCALKNYRRPVLASATDGVGTKVAVAQALGVYDTIGIDLIGMLVDDLVVVGAEPLFVTDYIACGHVIPERIAAIVSGIAAGCVEAGCALLGGETAEHPGLMAADDFDVAGATTGVVEADQIIDGTAIVAGDAVVAIEASGLHSNGYSLVRKVYRDAGWGFERQVAEFGRSLGEELLTPTRIYAKHIGALIAQTEVHGLSHVTGGGLANNLARVMPERTLARIDRSTWTPPAVFQVTQDLGQISTPDVEATLNMGVGMVAVVPSAAAGGAIELLAARGLRAWLAGEVIGHEGAGAAELHGAHA